MKKVLLIAIVFPVILVGAIYVLARMGVSKSDTVACTQQAKICPDGTSVSRGGPHCEFSACPNEILPTPPKPEPTPVQTFTQAGFGQTITDNDIRISPLSLVADSRCPKDVNCIQAGTVSVLLELKKEGETKKATMNLGESVQFGSMNIKLNTVNPEKYSKVVILPEDYRFEFLVTAGN